jgi:hypothetical protein
MSFSAEISVEKLQKGTRFSSAAAYEEQIRTCLPGPLRKKPFRVDLATQDPRPVNPMAETEKRINIFNQRRGSPHQNRSGRSTVTFRPGAATSGSFP